MNDELSSWFNKHTYIPFDQEKTEPGVKIEIILNEQVQTFSFTPPINLSEERKLLKIVTGFEATNCVFYIFDDFLNHYRWSLELQGCRKNFWRTN